MAHGDARVRAHRALEAALARERVCGAGEVGVHGVVYDVRAFAREHPGGQVWLRVSEGLDATALFETSHLNIPAAQARLRSLPARGHYTSRSPNGYWDAYRLLRRSALKALPTRAHRRMRFARACERSAWVAAALGLHWWLLRVPCFTPAWAAACACSSIANTVCGGYGHDALHQLSPWAMLLDWNGLSAFEWLLEHVVSHHPHVNTESDHDALSLEPFLRWLPQRAAGWWGDARTSPLKHLLYLIAEIAVPVQGLLVHRLRWSAHRYGAPLWMVLAPALFLVRAASLAAAHGLRDGTLTLLVTLAAAGYYFAFLAHESHKGVCVSAGADFVSHQLANTRDLSAVGGGSLSLFLDRQRLHHLFPSVCHTQLPQVKRALLRDDFGARERDTAARTPPPAEPAPAARSRR